MKVSAEAPVGFDNRDIRRAMDVYTLDNVYLGTVLAVVPGPVTSTGEQVDPGARQSSTVSGEVLGPAPTQSVGNAGPVNQSARAGYSSRPDQARPLGDGFVEVGRWWGVLGRRRIPLESIQTVSLERVLLKQKAAELRPRQ